ncbi:ABC transporter permease, partial [Paraburkholderia sp. SIMBA_061]
HLMLMLQLAKNDFRTRYAGSSLGIIWAFIQPLMTIAVYWFVFEVGFRSGSRPDGTPFILWLTCGMIPWFFVSEALLTSSNS